MVVIGLGWLVWYCDVCGVVAAPLVYLRVVADGVGREGGVELVPELLFPTF